MPNRLPWTERTFAFDFPVAVFPELIERLRGTPARVEEVVRSVPPDGLTRRAAEGTWSIQENAGHLVDLEALIIGRLDDYAAGAPVLRPADMSNRVTHEARHNDRSIADIVAALRRQRGDVIRRLESLPPDDFARTSRHPRLDRPMRLVDLLFFHAEHDDYHLARMQFLRRMWVEAGEA